MPANTAARGCGSAGWSSPSSRTRPARPRRRTPTRPGAGLLVFADDVPAAVGRAVAAGAAVVEPPVPDGNRAVLADPDGVVIELLKRDDTP